MISIGKTIMFIGIVLIIVGAILWFGRQKLNWLGRLPGDIRVEKENFKLYFPITTMLLLSIIISLLIRLIKRFL